MGVEVVPTVAWNYPTPATLSAYLAKAAAGVSTDAADDSAAPVIDDEFNRLLNEIEGMSEEDVQKLLDQDFGDTGIE